MTVLKIFLFILDGQQRRKYTTYHPTGDDFSLHKTVLTNAIGALIRGVKTPMVPSKERAKEKFFQQVLELSPIPP
jgi:hypothetical protein